MSRFKRVLLASVFATALVAVPVVPAVAQSSSTATASTVTSSGVPDCGGCWA